MTRKGISASLVSAIKVVVDTVNADVLSVISTLASINISLTFQHQPDAYLSQANPVSTTLYPVLATTANVRIYSITATITWGTTQPTPVEVVVTIDGQTIIYVINNPVTASGYLCRPSKDLAVTSQTMTLMTGGGTLELIQNALLEGRSVAVSIRVTWGTTQPTPLVCRVKYAKRT